MKITLLLATIALVASCEGRCRAHDAVSDEVPGGMCAASTNDTHGICLRGDEVYTCSIQGNLWHTATCESIGTVMRRAGRTGCEPGEALFWDGRRWLCRGESGMTGWVTP